MIEIPIKIYPNCKNETKLNVELIRIHFNNNRNQIELDFGLLPKGCINEKLYISDKVILRKNNVTDFILSKCEGVELNKEFKINTTNDFKFFSLYFDGTATFDDYFEIIDIDGNFHFNEINKKQNS